MKTILLLTIVLTLSGCHEPTHAVWTGSKFTCPVNTAIWASETEVLAGHDDYVYCVDVK
jgi:hypothetical protein